MCAFKEVFKKVMEKIDPDAEMECIFPQIATYCGHRRDSGSLPSSGTAASEGLEAAGPCTSDSYWAVGVRARIGAYRIRGIVCFSGVRQRCPALMPSSSLISRPTHHIIHPDQFSFRRFEQRMRLSAHRAKDQIISIQDV